MFSLFKKKRELVEVQGIGTFTVNPFNDIYMLDGKHVIDSLGEIDISFPSNNKGVSEYQIKMLFNLDEILSGIQELLLSEFTIISVMVPDSNSSEFDSIDAEIVIKSSDDELKSILLKNRQLEEIINVG